MRVLVASAVLCFLIGAPTFAHQEQQQDEKTKQQQQEEKQKPGQEPKTEKRQQELAKQEDKAKQNQQQDKERAKQEAAKQEEKQQKQTEKQRQEAAKEQVKQQKEMEKQQRAEVKQQGQEEQGNRVVQQPAAAPAHGGRRIPDDRFRAEFGREHHFHLRIHRGDRSFGYGGYSFSFVDVWPVGWAYTDDFYIDFVGDDYYLCDVEHPEVRLVVIVVA
jgi:hypothetical protein